MVDENPKQLKENHGFKNHYPVATLVAVVFFAIIIAVFNSGSAYNPNNLRDDALEIFSVNIDSEAYIENQEKELETEEEDPSKYKADPNSGLRSQAKDLSFESQVSPPGPVGRLKLIYPEAAKKNNVEANLYVELLIDKDGIVKEVKVLSVQLSVLLPAAADKEMKDAFKKSVGEILLNQKFSRTKINGEYTAVITEMPFKFTIEK